MINLSESHYGKYISERSRGKIIQDEHGFVAYRDDGPVCYVIEFYVKPESRKSGHGRILLKKLEDAAEKAKCERITGSIYLEDSCSSIVTIACLSAGFKISSANGGIIQVSKPVKQPKLKLPNVDTSIDLVPFNFDLHFELIKSWFIKRNFPHPDPAFLPQLGIVACKNGIPVAAGFLFLTDANLAMIGNLSSDPDSLGADRNSALDCLIEGLSFSALARGFAMVSCATNLPGLSERFKRRGFEQTDENVSHLRRRSVCL